MKKKPLKVNVSNSIYNSVDLFAVATNRSKSEIVEMILADFFNETESATLLKKITLIE